MRLFLPAPVEAKLVAGSQQHILILYLVLHTGVAGCCYTDQHTPYGGYLHIPYSQPLNKAQLQVSGFAAGGELPYVFSILLSFRKPQTHQSQHFHQPF